MSEFSTCKGCIDDFRTDDLNDEMFCESCENKEIISFDYLSNLPEFMSGDKYFAFSFGSSGVFGQGIWYYFWSDTIGSALNSLRKYYPDELLNIRSAVLGEWDCDNFTLAGHIDHS